MSFWGHAKGYCSPYLTARLPAAFPCDWPITVVVAEGPKFFMLDSEPVDSALSSTLLRDFEEPLLRNAPCFGSRRVLNKKLDSYSRQLILITRLEKGGKIIFVERSQKQCMRSEFWRK